MRADQWRGQAASVVVSILVDDCDEP